ncbi:uncharacterized protein LOC105182450 isoform X2 [Harpegnathos saltator]|uniref:Uncharacterized protein n=2 Tax=Harpegnathos saltator TaxID=610380 RepID=E2BG73_HARSA|nr:uncharacterized protein LOC105182450 isoform X2 [Harpegnathos saltator]EFN85341.1 hypothetical protein EAI_16025 [Harpegnathos saltator]
MPAESSIYWSSVDSRRSTSGSSGSGGGRHYVDPWDLENYAYLRRHSVADVPRRTRRPPTHERSLRDAPRARSEYWYASSLRQPEYDGSPPYAQELYRGPVRPTNNGCYYQQAIYEDEGMDYAAPLPVYAPVLEISRFPPQEERNLSQAIYDDRYVIEAMPPPHIDLNTYGHLRIDYTNSWNSLNRRISK